MSFSLPSISPIPFLSSTFTLRIFRYRILTRRCESGTIISAIHLCALLIFGNSIDPTWDYVFVVIWTALELGVAMAAACLPALRTLLLRLRPSSFSISSLIQFYFSSPSLLPSRGWLGRSRGKWDESSDIWNGKQGFKQISEINLGMTNVTWNGAEMSYSRQ